MKQPKPANPEAEVPVWGEAVADADRANAVEAERSARRAAARQVSRPSKGAEAGHAKASNDR